MPRTLALASQLRPNLAVPLRSNLVCASERYFRICSPYTHSRSAAPPHSPGSPSPAVSTVTATTKAATTSLGKRGFPSVTCLYVTHASGRVGNLGKLGPRQSARTFGNALFRTVPARAPSHPLAIPSHPKSRPQSLRDERGQRRTTTPHSAPRLRVLARPARPASAASQLAQTGHVLPNSVDNVDVARRRPPSLCPLPFPNSILFLFLNRFNSFS